MKSELLTQKFQEINNNPHNIYVLLSHLKSMIPQHTHEQGHILLVIDGIANLDIEQNTYFIPQGYFAWIPEKISHRISFESKNITLLNIYFPKQTETNQFYYQPGVYNTPSLLYHTFELIKSKTMIYNKSNWQFELLMTLKNVLPNIINKNTCSLRLPTSNHPQILKILNIIQANYANGITIQQVATEIGMSPRTLNRYLTNELHISFIQYVRIYRIVIAIRMLKENKNTISNIAYNVGYESLTAFSNTFYSITGHRPSQFLKLMQ